MKTNMDVRHLVDLAMKSYKNNQYTFTGFLTLAQMGDFYDNLKEIPPCGYEVSGGFEGAERVMIRFGREGDLGYTEPFPFVYVCIEPLMQKFSDELSHRDILGSIMNLGMERDQLGDIIIKNNRAWVVCQKPMASLLMEELTRVKHTSVRCFSTQELPDELTPKFEEKVIQSTQARIDSVVAKVWNLSRGVASKLFVEGKVAVNGRPSGNHSYILKENDVISVRGYGKFRFKEILGTSKKGKQILSIEKYV